MKAALSLFTLGIVLLLTSCAGARRDYADRGFMATGLENQVVILTLVEHLGQRHGVFPQEEREILDLVRQKIRSRYKGVQVIHESDGNAGLLKPAYSFDVAITRDHSEQKVTVLEDTKEYPPVPPDDPLPYIRVTRTHYIRDVTAVYKVVHLQTGRVVWQVTGGNRDDEWHENTYLENAFRERRHTLYLPGLLRPVTEKACGKLP